MSSEILEILLEQNNLIDELVGIIDWRSTAPTTIINYKEKREKFNEKLKKFISVNNSVSGSDAKLICRCKEQYESKEAKYVYCPIHG